YHERKHGQLFCNDSAKDILAMLLAECERTQQVTIQTHCQIEKIIPVDDGEHRFHLQTSKGQFACQSLVIATGGLSIPTMGASAFGYEVAKQFGHSVLPTRAGLVPFTFTDNIKAVTERLSGLALDVTMTAKDNTSFNENLLFTHRGLSGPVALQLSNYWQLGETVAVNLLPQLEMNNWLKEQKQQHPKSLLRTQLIPLLSKNLVLELQALHWPSYAETPLAEIPDSVLLTVAEALQAWQLKPSGTEGYRTAEVTLGGVDTRELSSKTMESKKQKGLYFIGEVVDVTGWLGGFNFQWAWSSGVAAGEFV
ncbi:MAG TPA: aminoacetone oxidase family FAD-binding enzyme, partial [Agitococcus sp.]|nr:aminoacetone oxidase family FAD-binding enzyme [Agitococcus sp.]